MSAAMAFLCKRLKNKFEIAVVDEPSVFEPLKFFCTLEQLSQMIANTGPEVLKLFSCSTQLSMKFQMLISMKISRNSAYSGSDKLRMQFSVLINVKMPTIVGILTFMSRKTFMLI